MSLYDNANEQLAELISALGNLEEARQAWASKMKMDDPEELNAAQAEHAALMPIHIAQIAANPGVAQTLKPQMDKLSAKVAQVGEIKAVMAVMESIIVDARVLTERAKAVASAAQSALKG